MMGTIPAAASASPITARSSVAIAHTSTCTGTTAPFHPPAQGNTTIRVRFTRFGKRREHIT